MPQLLEEDPDEMEAMIAADTSRVLKAFTAKTFWTRFGAYLKDCAAVYYRILCAPQPISWWAPCEPSLIIETKLELNSDTEYESSSRIVKLTWNTTDDRAVNAHFRKSSSKMDTDRCSGLALRV